MSEDPDRTDPNGPSDETAAPSPVDPSPPTQEPTWAAPEPTWAAPERRRLDRTDTWAMLAIAVVSLLIHVLRLGAAGAVLPNNHEECRNLPPLEGATCHKMIPLDEVHYVPDARDILRFGTESDLRVDDGEGESGPYVVHPPVGKWFIAAGIWIFGDGPFGWRIMGAIIGGLSPVVAYLIGRRLWAARWAAIMAAAFLAVDGLWLVQSRVAMLDIYAAAFLLLGVWLLIEDRDRTSVEHAGMRWWRIGAAAAFGTAMATKWSVAPIIAIALGMSFAWEMARVWRRSERHAIRANAAFLSTFLLIPIGIYLMTFLPWMMNENRYSPNECPEKSLPVLELACYHTKMIEFHQDLEKYGPVEPTDDVPSPTPSLEASHPYFGEAWSWPWLGRPVAHHFETLGADESERVSHILGLPNPLIWWIAFFIGLPLLLWWTIRPGDPIAPTLVGLILAGWLPYLAADLIDRPVFLFYATPIIPYLAMGVVHVAVRAVNRWREARYVVTAYVALVMAMFVYFYPVNTAHPIPRKGALGWEAHMWLNGPASDCAEEHQVKIRCWI